MFYQRRTLTQRREKKAFPIIALSMILALSSAASQNTAPKHEQRLACQVRQYPGRLAGSSTVTLGDFSRLGCKRTLEYFVALDKAMPSEYLKLRKTLQWQVAHTFPFHGGASGQETFEIMPGSELRRIYKPSEMGIDIINTSDVPFFVEATDLRPDGSIDEQAIAYVAVPAHSTKRMYTSQAQVPDPEWPSGRMIARLLQ